MGGHWHGLRIRPAAAPSFPNLRAACRERSTGISLNTVRTVAAGRQMKNCGGQDARATVDRAFGELSRAASCPEPSIATPPSNPIFKPATTPTPGGSTSALSGLIFRWPAPDGRRPPDHLSSRTAPHRQVPEISMQLTLKPEGKKSPKGTSCSSFGFHGLPRGSRASWLRASGRRPWRHVDRASCPGAHGVRMG